MMSLHCNKEKESARALDHNLELLAGVVLDWRCFSCVTLVSRFDFFAAPPSYAECVRGGASINDDGDSGKALGNNTFTPMYPFVNNYQFPSAPPAPFSQDPATKQSF